MSQANELLNNLTDEEVEAFTADLEAEEHIVVGEDRIITVPEALKRIAVQYDHNVETVMFDCPRYWDGLDMSEMIVYVNYMRSDNTRGMVLMDNVSVDETDENIMHFSWTISNNVTLNKGKLSFLVCIKKTDEAGNELIHWNSELCDQMYISAGLECQESIVSQYPDIITDLLLRMDYVEDIATPENMQEYIDTYFTTGKGDEALKRIVYAYLSEHEPTTPETMRGYVEHYLDEHPPLFVVGPEVPGVSCLWFNTGSGDDSENTYIEMTSDDGEGIYAEVEGVKTDYDLNIL